jgi:AICAR transformylase/IMP cyclohydrolase PurH (only IMP cyclohydrolase domain in Aful)
MVIRKNLRKKFALISVFNKNKLRYLCSNLTKHNYNLISTGSTATKIKSLGFKCMDISKLTKFKEMFDGRIKTLHPLIYAPLLYVRDNNYHKKQFISLKIPEIDIVVINLYPFESSIKKRNSDKTIEMIDIGGPSLLRAASKNYKFITPIVFVDDYSKLIQNIRDNNGYTDINFRKKMALKVFKETSRYDKIIGKWFSENKK